MMFLLDYGEGRFQYCLAGQDFRQTGCAGDLAGLQEALLRHAQGRRINAFCYRLPHGGAFILETVSCLDEIFLKRIAACEDLNPEIYAAMTMCVRRFSSADHYLLCDSALFTHLPDHARFFALPYELMPQVSRSGRHGLYHSLSYARACQVSSRPVQECVSLYLHDPLSITAIKQGKALETSDGFGESSRIISASGCGNIDASIVFPLISGGQSCAAVEELLKTQCGWQSITGPNCGLQEMLARQDQAARTAREMLIYQVCQEIGAQIAVLSGTRHIVFCGDESEELLGLCREMLSRLKPLGLNLKSTLSSHASPILTTDDSTISAYYFAEKDLWDTMSGLLECSSTNLA